MMLKYVLYGNPRSKKNSMQVGRNKYTGKTFVTQNKLYKDFEKDCLKQIQAPDEPINTSVNVQCIFYRADNKICDIPNLINATLDILVKAGVLADDNFNIVSGIDGTRVLIDAENPRTEVIITDF